MEFLNLFLTEIIHFLVTGLIILAWWSKHRTQRLMTVVVGLLGGFFIDVDHLFDYGLFLAKYHLPFSIREFLSVGYFNVNQKIYVLFHGWEYALLLGSLYLWGKQLDRGKVRKNALFNYRYWLLACWVITGHLVVDQLTNQPPLWGYFVIVRWLKDFSVW